MWALSQSEAVQPLNRPKSSRSRPPTPANPGTFEFEDPAHEQSKSSSRPPSIMVSPLHLQPPSQPSLSALSTLSTVENEHRSRVPIRSDILPSQDSELSSEGRLFAVRTIVFIRHGKSTWNLEKDKGRFSAISASISGAMEYRQVRNHSQKLSTAHILDAPLSSIGIEEAYCLSQFLRRQSSAQRKRRLATLKSHQSLANPLKDAIRHLNSVLGEDLTPISPATSMQDNLLSPSFRRRSCASLCDEYSRDDTKVVESDPWNLDVLNQRAIAYSITETEAQPPLHLTVESYQKPPVIRFDSIDDYNDTSIHDHPEYKKLRQAAQNTLSCLTHALETLEGHMYRAQFSAAPPTPTVSLSGPKARISPIVSNQTFQNVNSYEKAMDELDLPIEMDWIVDELYMGKEERSIVVSSNLRRAISTAVIGLWNRFAVNYFERIKILPALQEIGKGFDTLQPIKTISFDVSSSERESGLVNVDKLEHFYQNRLDVVEHDSKGRGESGISARQRLHAFAEFVFQQEAPMIIAVGHSTWMREFFREFLSSQSTHIAKKSKVSHSSAIAFRFSRRLTSQGEQYRIYEGSITPIYRGFV